MTLPEFRPQKLRAGDPVQVHRDGQVISGKIVSRTFVGNYWVENEDGHEILADKNDVFPIQPAQPGNETKPVDSQVKPQKFSESFLDDSWKDATPDSLAEYLSGGGKATYSSGDDFSLDTPIHDVWMGSKDNLPQLIDFDAVWSGKSKIVRESPGESASAVHENSSDSSTADAAQTILDAAGVVDPTPISDGTNAAISIGRAIKDPRSAAKHLRNAAISAVSMIPYVGDLAKGAKYGGKAAKAAKPAKTVENASEVAEAAEAVKAVDNASSAPGGDDFDTKGFVESIFGRNDQRGNSSSPVGRSGSRSNNGSGGSGGSGGGPSDPNSPGDPDDESIRKNLGGFKDTVVDVTGKLGKLGVATYTFAEAQNFLNKAVIEYNRNLLKYNGELTKAYSELDFGRLSREFRQAQKQSGPMSGLIGAQNDLEESMMNFRGDWQVIATDIQTGLTKIADIGIRILDYISPLEEMYGLIRKWLPWGKPDAQKFDGNAAIKELDAWRNKAADAQNRGRKV
jgi:hypothetical protein